MRHLPILLVALALIGLPGMDASAQRIAFVNTKYILDQMPEYTSAQKELDRLSRTWQDEIDDRHAQIKRMREAYNAEGILLTEEMKRSRLEDIQDREREARDLQKRRFGPNGDLFKKRQELIQPIQDRVYTAIKEVAGTSYLAIFDLSAQSGNLLFASEKYDKSDSVLRKLGIRPGKGGSESGRDDDFGQDPEDSPAPPQGDPRGGGQNSGSGIGGAGGGAGGGGRGGGGSAPPKPR
ncbi:MAG: OmpH family outer membrane protein [Flavobacteriales bacterium]|nr:OmpH family outer membrane protein [Flavobacteriales bacterium]